MPNLRNVSERVTGQRVGGITTRGGFIPYVYGGSQRYDGPTPAEAMAGTPSQDAFFKPAAPCGTDAAYHRHVRKKEKIDDACRTAHTNDCGYNTARNARRAAERATRPRCPACNRYLGTDGTHACASRNGTANA